MKSTHRLVLCIVLGLSGRVLAGSPDTPPPPPPSHYVFPEINMASSSLEPGQEVPILRIAMNEVFNFPRLDRLAGRIRTDDSYGRITRVRLGLDENRNGLFDPGEPVLAETAPDDTGGFDFPSIDAGFMQRTDLFLLLTADAGSDPSRTLTIVFAEDAFQGEDTWFDFNGKEIENIPLSVPESPGSDLPADFLLKQNYPNPFNPETTILLGIAKPCQVTLRIYNLLGQKVRTLLNEKQPAGWKRVHWDGKNDSGIAVSSGIYLAVAQMDRTRLVIKLQLIR